MDLLSKFPMAVLTFVVLFGPTVSSEVSGLYSCPVGKLRNFAKLFSTYNLH